MEYCMQTMCDGNSKTIKKTEELRFYHNRYEAAEWLAPDTSEYMCHTDKVMFVTNLGKLLAQTREEILGCTLVDKDHVDVVYTHGFVRTVNIAADSYTAIILDVCKAVLYD